MLPLIAAGLSLGTLLAHTGARRGAALLLLFREYTRTHRPGEGPLTDLYGGEELAVDAAAAAPLGRLLAALAGLYAELRPFVGRQFAMTVSEGADLADLVGAVQAHPSFAVLQQPRSTAIERREALARLRPTIVPVVNYLTAFPR